MDFAWMAWSVPTAIFFIGIAVMLAVMSVLAVLMPSQARTGLLGFETQRGDRLFVALLGSAFIHLGWLALTDWPLWVASGVAVLFCALTLRFA